MRLKFYFAKAIILVSILLFISLIVFNQVVQNDRLAIFQKYSTLVLPANYTVEQNTALPGNYRTSVRLIFKFDKENYTLFLRRNNLNNTTLNHPEPNEWVKRKNILSRRKRPFKQTVVVEIIDTQQKTLEFRYQKE
jgi:hypothetical protein